ncbi:MAG TPA: peroxidase-related enzyme [Alphaproteobacteria bacterium]
MPFFSGLTEDSGVRDILAMNPAAGRALIEYHEVVLRGPSPLSVAERELIAAYVSGLNGCHYCHGVHAVTAEAFGIPATLMKSLLDDPETADVDPKLKPLLAYARKLTLTPARMTEADAKAVYAAGWTEKALHDACSVCCLFNFMNRLLDGHGVHGNDSVYQRRGQMLKDDGYAPLIKLLGG